MKRRVQDYWCALCYSRTGHTIELEDDAPQSIDSCPQEMPCESCNNPHAYRVFSAPRLMTRAAVPDGTDRGDGWRIAREAARVHSESLSQPWFKRLDHEKEVARLNRRAERESHRNKHEPSKSYDPDRQSKPPTGDNK